MAKRQTEKQLGQVGGLVTRRQQRVNARIRQVSLSRLLSSYPLLVWAGIWLTVLIVSAIAVSGLISPVASVRQRASSAAFGSSPTAEVEPQPRNPFSIWLFGAVTLSCTAGSILVSKRLTTSDRLRSALKRTPQVKTPIQPGSPVQKRQFAAAWGRRKLNQPKRLKPLRGKEFAPRLPTHSMPASGAEKLLPCAEVYPAQLQPLALRQQTTVTVLPAEENHPLDWTEDIADTMDIRKRRSLSSWL